jgi:structural maintenance of chromosome 4
MQGVIDSDNLFFVQAAQAGVQELRSKATSLRQKAEEARASQAASTSQNRVLDSLTKLKQTGRIDGFHV